MIINRNKFIWGFFNLKVSLFRMNNLFQTNSKMLTTLLEGVYPDQVVTQECIDNFDTTQFKNGMPQLISASILKQLFQNHFDEMTSDYHQILSLFPRNDFIYYFYNLIENKWLKKLWGIIYPYVLTNAKFKIPFNFYHKFFVKNDIYPNCSFKMLSHEFWDHQVEPSEFFIDKKDPRVSENYFSIRLLSKKAVDLKMLALNPSLMTKEIKSEFKKVILHIHGGGFITMSSSSHQSYLRKFVRQFDSVVFSIDYPLAPKKKHKDIFESIIKGYFYVYVG